MTDEPVRPPDDAAKTVVALPQLPDGQIWTQLPMIAQPSHMGPDGNLKIDVGDEPARVGIPTILVYDGHTKAFVAIFLQPGMSWTLAPTVAPGLWRPGLPQ